MEIEDIDPHCKPMNNQNIVLQNRIGRGCQGSVYIGYDVEKKQRYAIKVMNIGVMNEKQKQRLSCQIQSNFTLSQQFQYKYFPFFYGYWLHDSQIFLAFQLCQGNALEGIRGNRTHATSYSFAYALLYDILKGLQLLQQRNIIHRDLKPENMLLDKGMFKICDLGLSKIAENGKKLTIDVGNLMSRSPESYSQSYDSRTDVWSLGVNVFWIAFGTLPFDQQIKSLLNENNILQIKQKISTKNFQVNLGPVQTHLLQILSDMLQINRFHRLSAQQLLAKYFYQTISNFPVTSSIQQQLQFVFLFYLKSRGNLQYSQFLLITILLVMDYEKTTEFTKSQKINQQKIQHNKRQICRRVQINIYLILQFMCDQHCGQIDQQIIQIMGHFLKIWEIQLIKTHENKSKINRKFKKVEEGLKMHQIQGIKERFPFALEAVKVYKSWLDDKQICIWDIPQFDLRLLKI